MQEEEEALIKSLFKVRVAVEVLFFVLTSFLFHLLKCLFLI